MRSYLITFAAVVLLGFLGTAAVSAYDIWLKPLDADTELLRHQRDKAAAADRVDTILVGDSSLGNAVDARLLSRLTGHECMNLALTGSTGYAGSYNMIRRALAAKPVRNVVIMQTVNIAGRAVPYHGHIVTTPDLDLAPFPVLERLRLARAAIEALVNPHALKLGARLAGTVLGIPVPTHMADDYIAQGRPLGAALAKAHYPTGPVIGDNDLFLGLIGTLCRDRELNCLYAFGPIYDALVPRLADLTRGTARLATEAGIPLVSDTPFALPETLVGDAVDHAVPEGRAVTTGWLADRLAGRLH